MSAIDVHVLTWIIGLILFALSFGLHKAGKEKISKILHMVLRLVYILIIGSGIGLLAVTGMDFMHTIKMLVGIWVIGMMEMVLIRTKKGEKTTILWILFVVALILVLLIGYNI
ncbi:DUF1516 family protein [Bacillus sp. B1-b2]|uniref:DUF1516 family protein n=1 Tax=Bacillus sp. B1-b2 TaxID=2653201 RepID=UPI0012614364|nr:DUF1516 family protein [Bacillus sp. B1-b2]KAB7665394.1 YisL family protein [Bacillus sp. B1-b2]